MWTLTAEDNILQLVFTSVILSRMTYAISAWWGYATAADSVLSHLSDVLYALVCTQQMDQTCISWFLTRTKHCLHEYWRINIMCCDNYY